MSLATEARSALRVVTGEAVSASGELVTRVKGSPDARRLALLDSVPALIGYYALGSAALAADYYEEERAVAGVPGGFAAELVLVDRTVNIRRGVAWASDPLFEGDEATAVARMREVVQLESARPFRDTITTNRRRDPEAVGWRRIAASSGCKLCMMLASRGAVYRHDTARFAAHPNCSCTAQPVFGANDTGEEASAIQYVASQRRRSPKQQAMLRDYLNTNFSDFPG